MNAPALNSALYVGKVMHHRLRPVRRRFVYPVFSLLVDLDEVPDLDRRLRWFGHNRFSLLSLHDRDHGPRDGSPLRPWIEEHCRQAGLDVAGGRIRMLSFPRVLGYAFNPLTIYWIDDPAGRLRAVLYQVKNTFGEQHGYLCPVSADHAPGQPIRQRAEKSFHVSPFMDVAGRYSFRVREPAAHLGIVIHEQDGTEADLMIATHHAERRPLTDRSLLAIWARHPLMNLMVIGGIHWEALKVWLGGVAYHSKPAPPQVPVTLGTALGNGGTVRELPQATGDPSRTHAPHVPA